MIFIACAVHAQVLTSYSCDFESATETAQWTLNAGTKGKSSSNKWYVGAAGSFGYQSAKGLYVSSGTGADTLESSYKATGFSGFQMAYRPMTLAAGTYTIQFDWISKGKSDDGIYVFWVDATQSTNSNWNTTTTPVPAWVPSNAIFCQGSAYWNSVQGTFTTTGAAGKLVVMWYNNNGSALTPAGAIDNIRIFQGNAPTAPANAAYNSTTGKLSWMGGTAPYEVIVFNAHTKTQLHYDSITTRSTSLPDLVDEGMYYFYVRSNNGTQHSKWTITSKFVWIKGARCIDFLDLGDQTHAGVCYSGGWSEGGVENLKEHCGQIDYGYDSSESMHTIHYVQGETDPRTGNKLKTIPDGEIASVRINGLWENTNNKTATVEYKYNVQAGVSDLLVLQYACVLESGGHEEGVQPRFKLEVLNSSGQAIDQCSQCDFKAAFGDTKSWHHYTEYNNRDIYWSDWNKITVSLRNYVGQNLTIRLTAYTCAQSIHLGYAYFTLNCQGGDLQGIACGDFSTDHFEAPEGFNYRWYKAANPSKTLGTESRFDIPSNDTTIYLVDMISKAKTQCYYTLEANPNPRFPRARAAYQVESKNCQHIVKFVPDCKVVQINRLTLDSIMTEEDVQEIRWIFSDGDTVVSLDPVDHVYPAEGGTYQVIVEASMSNGVCVDAYTYTVDLPNIKLSRNNDTIDICEAEYKDSHDKIHYAVDGDFVDTVGYETNEYGCEALEWHAIRFHPIYDTLYKVRMCDGGEYVWPANGLIYKSQNPVTLGSVEIKDSIMGKSIWGCDSIIRLHMIVDAQLSIKCDPIVEVCSDNATLTIPYKVLTGAADGVMVYSEQKYLDAPYANFESSYSFSMDEDIIIPLPQQPYPDDYEFTLVFESERCEIAPLKTHVRLRYSRNVLEQKKNFISLLNKNYNGGFNFQSYQWYRNGEKVEGATQSYLPTQQADRGAVYYVEVVRSGETQVLSTCDIVFGDDVTAVGTVSSELLVWPTMAQPGTEIVTSSSGSVSIYNVLGTLVSQQLIGQSQHLIAPKIPGIYVLYFAGGQKAEIMVK